MLRRIVGVLALVALLAAGCTSESPPEPESPFLGKAAEITDLHAQAKWAEIRRDFDEEMLNGLSEEMLASAWRDLTATVGAYKSRGEPRVVGNVNGIVAIDTPMYFERGEYKSRVSFRPDGKIAGLFILNPEVD